MSGYINYIDHTKDADAKKKSESPKSLPNRSDLLRHKRRVSGRSDMSMEDMRIHYRLNQMAIQMYPIHPSFMVGSYGRASYSTGLGRRARRLLNRRVANRWVSDSSILRASLVDDNGVLDSRIVRPNTGFNYAIDNQAHHIVETSNGIGQEFLTNADIHPNSAANGVLLPVAEGDGTGNATVHNGSHINEYTACVNAALENATRGLPPHTIWYRESVIAVLIRIRWILLNNNMAINKYGDPNYVDDSQSNKESISDIFRAQGLI